MPRKPRTVKTPKPSPRQGWSHEQARFEECVDCAFYKPFHTNKNCNGCESGENFEEVIEELDPYAMTFLSRKNR